MECTCFKDEQEFTTNQKMISYLLRFYDLFIHIYEKVPIKA